VHCRGSYSQSVDGGVRKLQLCNSPGARPRGGITPDAMPVGPASEAPGCYQVRPPRLRFCTATASCRPRRRIARLAPATQRRSVYGRRGARDRPMPCARTGPGLHRSTGREDAGDLWAEEPAGPDRPPAAGSHCLNGLPVHRSVFVAARRGEGGRQGAGGKPAVRLGHAPQWLAFMLASGNRRHGRHLTPPVVIMNGHTGTLAAKAGYCLDVATPACRSRSASSVQAGAASSSMPLSGLAGAASADTSPVSSPALP